MTLNASNINIKICQILNSNGCDKLKVYLGKTARPFKTGHYNEHNNSFKPVPKSYKYAGEERTRSDERIAQLTEEKRTKYELSKYIWHLKDKGKDPTVKWKIKCKAHPYKNGHAFCDLCVTESAYIVLGDPETMLNKRTEIFHKCTDKNKFKLQALLKPP